MTYADEVHAVGMYGAAAPGMAEQHARDDTHRCAGGYTRQGFRLPRRLHRGSAAWWTRYAATPTRLSIYIIRRVAARCCAPQPRRSAPQTSSYERERHQQRAARTKAVLLAAGLPVMPSNTHIVPILSVSPRNARKATDLLLQDHGIYIQPINYPTVPKGASGCALRRRPITMMY